MKIFTKIPIELLDKKIQEMGMEQEGEPAFAWIDINEVVSFRETKEDDKPDIKATIIYMSDGQSYWTSLSPVEFLDIVYPPADYHNSGP